MNGESENLYCKLLFWLFLQNDAAWQKNPLFDWINQPTDLLCCQDCKLILISLCSPVAFIGHDVCLGKNLLLYMAPYGCADLRECGEPITLFISSLWSPQSWTSVYQFPPSSTRLAQQTIAHCEGLKSVSSRLDAFSTWRQSFFLPSFQPARLSDTEWAGSGRVSQEIGKVIFPWPLWWKCSLISCLFLNIPNYPDGHGQIL